MTARLGFFGLLATVTFLSGLGCTACQHRAQYDSLGVANDVNLQSCQREQVAVVLVGGLNPFCDNGRAEIVQQIHEAGFSKVFSGSQWHTDTFARMVKDLAHDRPDIRVLVVSFGGDKAALALVEQLRASGIQADTNLDMTGFDETASHDITAKLIAMASRVETHPSEARIIQPLNENAATSPPIEIAIPITPGR